MLNPLFGVIFQEMIVKTLPVMQPKLIKVFSCISKLVIYRNSRLATASTIYDFKFYGFRFYKSERWSLKWPYLWKIPFPPTHTIDAWRIKTYNKINTAFKGATNQNWNITSASKLWMYSYIFSLFYLVYNLQFFVFHSSCNAWNEI